MDQTSREMTGDFSGFSYSKALFELREKFVGLGGVQLQFSGPVRLHGPSEMVKL